MAKQTNRVEWEFLLNQRQLDQGLRKSQRGFKSTEKESSTLEKGMGKLKQAVIGLGLAFGAREAFQFGKDAIDAASDYEESVNAIEVAAGDAAVGIQRFGQSAATDIGLSETAVNELGVAFAGFAENVKGDKTVEETFEDYATRAADFASVMNLEATDAVRIFQSALSGETEPIRKFGIDMSAAAVASHAAAVGIGEVGAEMTGAEKQAARYSLLMQETAQFAGDFENTSGELANQQRILNAEWENAQVALGQGLLPAMQAAVPVAVDLVRSIADMPNDLAEAVSWWNELGSAVRDATEGVTFGLIENKKKWGENEKAQKAALRQNDRLTDSFAAGLTVMETASEEVGHLILGFDDMSESALRNLQDQLGLTNTEMLELISTTEDEINANFGLEDGYKASAEAALFLQQALDNELTVAMEEDAEAARDLAFDVLAAAKANEELLKQTDFLTEAQKDQLGIFALLEQEAAEALQKLRDEWGSTTGRVRAYEQAVKDSIAQLEIMEGKVPTGGFEAPGGQVGLAAGGTLSQGQSAVVGEQGPEIITAGRSMRVHPNGTNPYGGGGGTTVNIVVNALDPDAAAVAVADAIRSYRDRYGEI